MRQLIPLRKLVEEAEESGESLDALFVDRDDIVEIDEDTEEN